MRLQHQIPRVVPIFMLAYSLLSAPAWAQFSQQGPKLIGTDAIGTQSQGYSVSLSGDGNTAIVGGPSVNNGDDSIGAAWVFTRSGGVWSQQAKLVGTDVVGSDAWQGLSVSLSGDGNTAIVGGPFDNDDAGAAWIFTRSGGVWSQQAKLVGTGAIVINGGGVGQGTSVSLSGDGNTAVVGSPSDNNHTGAAWVFTRSQRLWTQQAELTSAGTTDLGRSASVSDNGNTAVVGGVVNGSSAAFVYTRSRGVWSQQAILDGIGNAGLPGGPPVSLSGNGNTVIVGTPNDSGLVGAAWVFGGSRGTWSLEAKLVGTGAVGNAAQGTSVALSDGGNTAIVGGDRDNDVVGAAWVFKRSGPAWNQQGTKLVGTGVVGNAAQGFSVSVSGDGNTVMVGGPQDNNSTGAAWVYAGSAFAGTPGTANCIGESVAALISRFGGVNAAAAALEFPSSNALQNNIVAFCGG